VYGTVGSDAAESVDYPITNGVPDIAKPTAANTGTFTVPSDFASMQGYTFDSSGQIVVSGDTSANAEMLTQPAERFPVTPSVRIGGDGARQHGDVRDPCCSWQPS
jgi:hypothetical protein